MNCKMYFLKICVTILFHFYQLALSESSTENCFMYHVNSTVDSPSYQLREYSETHVTINDLYGNGSAVVQDNKGKCLAGLFTASTFDASTCQTKYILDKNFTTLVFRQKGTEITVYERGVMKDEKKLEGLPDEIEVVSDTQVNVIFDCPGNCYEFENATIHKTPLEDDADTISLKFYAKIIDMDKAKESIINLRYGNNWEGNRFIRFKSKIPQSAIIDQWTQFDILASYKESNGKYAYDLNATFNGTLLQNSEKVPALVISRDLYLDFGKNTGIRWALHCKPYEGTSNQSLMKDLASENDGTTHSNTANNSEHGTSIVQHLTDNYWLLYGISMGVMTLIIIGLCICTCCLKRQKDKLQRQIPQQGNLLDMTQNGQLQDEAHDYEYIDPKAIVQHMEREKSSSKQQPTMNVDEESFQIPNQSGSHTSVNSLYGMAEKEGDPKLNNNNPRNSHTSMNSLYGCNAID